MDDPEATRIVFECEAPGQRQWCHIRRATVEIEIGSPAKGYVGDTGFNSVIRLRVGKQTFEVERVLDGYQIKGFANGLRQLYETLEGSVRLQDWDGELLLCLTVIDRARGRVAIGGQFAPIVLDTRATSEERFVSGVCGGNMGIVISFEGLSFDQTYLQRPLADLQRFVFEHRVQCEATGGYPANPSTEGQNEL